jgi:molecular chaperone GrpE
MKKSKKEKSKAKGSHGAESAAEGLELPKSDREQTEEKGEMEELRSKVESLQKEKDELFGQLQRISADYANYQKRLPKQISDSISYEKERIIKSLLPALDNFEHTLLNAHSAEDVDVLVKGIQIIYDQLIEILKSHSVEQIKALDEPFNPAIHEAMTQRTNTEKDQNVVLEEFQKGYTLNGRVIRPSKVIVNKLPTEEMKEPPDETAVEKDDNETKPGEEE